MISKIRKFRVIFDLNKDILNNCKITSKVNMLGIFRFSWRGAISFLFFVVVVVVVIYETDGFQNLICRTARNI